MDNNQSKNDNNNKTSDKDLDISSIDNNNNNFSKMEEIVKTIPLFEEKFALAKKTEETQLILEKKLITSTKKIEIPIKYEEIYINGKEFDLYDENEITEIFSKIKHKITDAFSNEKDKHSSEEIPYSHDIEIIRQKNDPNIEYKNNSNEQIVPLYPDENNYNHPREENIVPIWGEEIIINKRMVKLGEIVIKKYQINENKKIEVDVKTEQLTVKYPDNYKEEII